MKQNVNYLETFRKNINKSLLENGISQKELAEDLQLAPPILNRYIRGERRMPDDLLSETAQILHTTEAELFGVKSLDEVQAIYSIPDNIWRNAGEGLELAASLQLENNPLMEVFKNVLTVKEIDCLYEYVHKKTPESITNPKIRQRLFGFPSLSTYESEDWNKISEDYIEGLNSNTLTILAANFQKLEANLIEKQNILEEKIKNLDKKFSELGGTQNDC